MPTYVSLEDLITLNDEIKKVKRKFPEAGLEIATLIKKTRKFGYKNFCRLFTAEWSPETLKSGSLSKDED